MAEIVYKGESYVIMGACFEVHSTMGSGFLEGVYQESLAKEFEQRGVRYVSQPKLRLEYKGEVLEQTYQPDFVCFDKIIVELKAAKAICDEHRGQVHNYLRATGHRLGLLVNFGAHPKLEYERIAC